tara:strand:- start:129 stop:320 length:192 start_codon:yes stop_codon:yes gene_type:complete
MLKQPIVGSRVSAQVAIGIQTAVTEAPTDLNNNVLDFTSANRPVTERVRPARGPRNGKQKRRK